MSVWDTDMMPKSLIFPLIILLVSCDTSLCSNELIEEVTSPNGKYVASIFERNCGATTPYIRVVSLRLAHTNFSPDDDNNWVFTLHGRSDVNVRWVEGGKLNISYSGSGDQPTQRRIWRDVIISYD